MDWHDLFVAIGLLLVLEGILPFLNPAGLRNAIRAILEMSDSQLRYLGLGSMIAGVLLLSAMR